VHVTCNSFGNVLLLVIQHALEEYLVLEFHNVARDLILGHSAARIMHDEVRQNSALVSPIVVDLITQIHA
jgi:hypothetical protein